LSALTMLKRRGSADARRVSFLDRRVSNSQRGDSRDAELLPPP
jgi:hypothetical protein